jgi:hypothetical protein
MEVHVGHTSRPVVSGNRRRDKRRRAEAGDMRPQFRLRPGQDDLLIEWLTSLAPRQRSAAIRQALYQHLAARRGTGEDKDREWREDPDLAAALDALF